MSIRLRLTVAPHHNATPSPKPSLAEEVRELHKLAKDRRAASLALFRNSTKHPALPRTNVPPRGRERVAA
jgi:hypothetical protein